MPTDLSFDYAHTNGVRLHYAYAGEGPLMVFVHGYPRHWYLWRHQLTEFAGDHLAVAYDMRGYNLSSKPEGDVNYSVRQGVEDLRGLVEHLGHDQLVLVGHDWGGGIAWAFALHYPELVRALVVLSAPHPALLDEAIRGDPEYRDVRAQYLFPLQQPDAPESLAQDEFEALRPTCLDHPFLDESDRAAYVEAWSQPGAMRSMLALDRREGLRPATETAPARGSYVSDLLSLVVSVPTLCAYGDGDWINPPVLFEGLEKWAPGVVLKRFPGTHWIPEEQPERLNAEIRAFIEALDEPEIAAAASDRARRERTQRA